MTETSPRQDRDMTETRPRHDRDITETRPRHRPRHDRDITETRPRHDRDMTETRPRHPEWNFFRCMGGARPPYPCKTPSLSLLGNYIYLYIYVYIYIYLLWTKKSIWKQQIAFKMKTMQAKQLSSHHQSAENGKHQHPLPQARLPHCPIQFIQTMSTAKPAHTKRQKFSFKRQFWNTVCKRCKE